MHIFYFILCLRLTVNIIEMIDKKIRELLGNTFYNTLHYWKKTSLIKLSSNKSILRYIYIFFIII